MLDKLKKALEGKEIDFDINELQSDLDNLKQGFQDEIESTKNKSQQIGKEILLKELKSELGFEYDQRKNPENLKKAYSEKFGLKDAPANDDINNLTNNFNKQLEEKNAEIEKIKNTYKKESDDKIIIDSLRSEFSSFDGKTNYKTEDLITIAKSKGEFSVVDGKVFQSKDGDVIKNDQYQAITSTSFVNSMMQDGYIKKAEGGKIQGDIIGGGKQTMEQFILSQESKGINVNSQDFSENMNDAIKNGSIEL